MEKKRILCLMDYGKDTHTGFATVSKNVIQGIKKHFGEELLIDMVAINNFSEEAYFTEDGVFVMPAQGSDPKKDEFGRNFYLKSLAEGNYDATFIMQDIGVIQPIIQVMKHVNLNKRKENKKQFKSFFYFPVDCNLIKQLTKDLEFFDVLATYTEFGREEVCRFRPELRKNIKIINHGNNNASYYPIHKEERDIFREEYFEDEKKDKFIVSVINRNQPRKDVATSIFAFQEMKNNWKHDKKPFLYLHMHPNDPMGIDLRALMMQTDMEEFKDYMFPPRHIENHDATESQLRSIYNSSDLFLTTNLGEGWGLTITEAMACKLPIVAPLHTSITEISNNGERIYPITEFIPICLKTDNMIRNMSFIDNVVEVMEEAVNDILIDSEVKKLKVENSYNYVKTKLDWNYIVPKFVGYIKDML